jgi:hypothetical protein
MEKMKEKRGRGAKCEAEGKDEKQFTRILEPYFKEGGGKSDTSS